MKRNTIDRAKAIKRCLELLRCEASDARLAFVAHLIDVAVLELDDLVTLNWACPTELVRTDTKALSGRDGKVVSLSVAHERDIWQAAALLVGLYGDNAVSCVKSHVSELTRTGSRTELQTWSRIAKKVQELLSCSPPRDVRQHPGQCAPPVRSR